MSYLRGGQVLFGWLHGIVGRLPGHPDLYDAIRRGEARQTVQRPAFRLYALAAGRGRASPRPGRARHRGGDRSGGTIYVEARRTEDAAQ